MKAFRPLYILVLFVFVLGFVPVSAQTGQPPPQTIDQARAQVSVINSELDTRFGPAQVGDAYVLSALDASPSCTPSDVSRDPATAGPITVNSQYLIVSTSFCPDSNSALIGLGSKWWGLSGKTQRVWGFVAVRDANDILVDILPFDQSNDPLTAGALNIHLSWPAPYDWRTYRFELEANLRMLPDNIGPGTIKSTWYYQTEPVRIFLPVIARSGPENCEVQLHIFGQRGTDEFYCFSIQGNNFAMLHFGHSEIVTVEWVDQNHNRLGNLPGTNPIFRLTWWDGYKDYHSVVTTLQATLWPKNGNPPWLATEHMISGQFTDASGKEWRVSVPMIWDP